MPKKIKAADEFTKASIKNDTKVKLKMIAAKEGMFEYEIIEEMLKKCYPTYFRGQKITV